MTVQFIIDDAGLEEGDHVRLSDPQAIPDWRTRIRDNLAYSQDTVLSISLSAAFFRRFKDFEGAEGVSVRCVSPFNHLRHQIGTMPPLWLTETLAEKLDLYDRPPIAPAFQTTENTTAKVLALCHSDLAFPDDISAFYQALGKQSPAFIELLKIDTVNACLRGVLSHFVSIEIATSFITELEKSASVSDFMLGLAEEQHWEKLRQTLGRYEGIMDEPLPPRNYPQILIKELPPLPLEESKAGSLPTRICASLETLERRIRSKQQTPEALADFIFLTWPKVLSCLEELLQNNANLASQALYACLQTLPGEQASALATKVKDYLQDAPCKLLQTSANVDEVLVWGEQYFKYALRELTQRREPENDICTSFSQWVLEQQPRIARSNSDWRTVAQLVEQYLNEDYVVLLYMVDALSAIHTDILQEQLAKKIPDTHIEPRMLFAPLPTLTEVGKAAVLTGIPACEVSTDYETALRQRYGTWLNSPDALRIFKSWEESGEHLAHGTRLVVYLENRIDERLHGSLDFSKHREEIVPILSQLTRILKGWFADAASSLGKKAVALITADHGVTSVATRQDISIKNIQLKERAVKLKSNSDDLPVNLKRIATGKKNYAVPLNRVRFGDTPLTHGGLTPEEVLIPLCVVSREPLTAQVAPVEITAPKQRCRATDKGWQVELNIIPAIRLEKLRLQVKHPFQTLGSTPTYSDLSANIPQPVYFDFGSEHEQSGLTSVRLEVRYKASSSNEWTVIQQDLALELAPHMLQHTQAASEFDSMF